MDPRSKDFRVPTLDSFKQPSLVPKRNLQAAVVKVPSVVVLTALCKPKLFIGQNMNLISKTLVLAAVAISAATASAQDRGTKEEAKALADAAYDHAKKIGAAQALKDFSVKGGAWTKKDLYVFVIDYKGTMQAHGANAKLIGTEQTELKDQNGKLFVAEMIQVTQAKGYGWVDYVWPHPISKKLEDKTSYVRKMADFDGFLGVGVYR
jgi:cytochrome c